MEVGSLAEGKAQFLHDGQLVAVNKHLKQDKRWLHGVFGVWGLRAASIKSAIINARSAIAALHGPFE